MRRAFPNSPGYVDWFELPDILVGFLTLAMLVFVILHSKRLRIVRRLTILFAFLQLLRSFTVIVTSLPDASPVCAAQFGSASGRYKQRSLIESLPAFVFRALKIVFKPGSHITCGDMVFSGHTLVTMSCAMVCYYYCYHHCKLLSFDADEEHLSLCSADCALLCRFATYIHQKRSMKQRYAHSD